MRIVRQGDSIFIHSPIYDTGTRGRVMHDGSMITGHWYNHVRGGDYKIPFIAQAGDSRRFTGEWDDPRIVEGQWAVLFDPLEKATPALGFFTAHDDGRVTGTFATETGDHRSLEGVVQNDSLKLSSFDGSHIYFYRAALDGDRMEGEYLSGIHWKEAFTGVRSDTAGLRDPHAITHLATDTSRVRFDLRDLHGERVTSNDPRFAGRVLLLNVMGSWCSNCTDHSLELHRLHQKYHAQGLEVVAMAFEKHEDPERARRNLLRYRDALGLEYPILFAGRADKETLQQRLPYLDRVQAYPTTIILDHKHVVRRIITGSYGPGTGVLHLQHQQDLDIFIQDLLGERTLP